MWNRPAFLTICMSVCPAIWNKAREMIGAANLHQMKFAKWSFTKWSSPNKSSPNKTKFWPKKKKFSQKRKKKSFCQKRKNLVWSKPSKKTSFIKKSFSQKIYAKNHKINFWRIKWAKSYVAKPHGRCWLRRPLAVFIS